MYNAYVKEKEKLDVLETETGFAAYFISEFSKTLEIGDFYVKPEFRNGRKSTLLLNKVIELAKEKKCKRITCCVELNLEKPEASLYGVLRHKFKYSHVLNDVIYFYQNIEE